MTVWDQLVGQRHAVKALKTAVGGHGMSHSWLFTGPPGSGRSNAAIAFAAALECEQGGCGTCHECHTVLAGTHADVSVIRTQKLSIGVDEVRDLVRRAALSPVGRRWQILIVEDADRLTDQTSTSGEQQVPWDHERAGTFGQVAPRTDWNPILRAQLDEPYWAELQQFVAQERAQGPVYPSHDEVFAALHLTPYSSVKVLILGQDPYHGPGQAHGLCFSVRRGVPAPPSLQNIFKELEADLGISPPTHGCLDAWATQGVLLLNATLTVRARQAASHQGKGWERFTDAVIRAVNDKPERVVFILWGSSARKKKGLVDLSRHVVIESPHPSPLSAHNGFFGSRPFSRANEALAAAGRDPVDWRIAS